MTPPPETRLDAVGVHNRVLQAAQRRIDQLEGELADLLIPILERAGGQAAAGFQKLATDHLTAAAGLDVQSNSTMICVKPRPDEADAIADPDGLPAETLHVTLVYLGELDGPLEPIAEALRPVAAEHAPLAGVVGGYGRFEPPGVGILLPDVPGLVELRVAVTDALVGAGIDYARSHGFQAHITVDAEPEPGEAEMMLERAAQAPLHFDSLLIVRGDVEIVELPFAGRPPLTAAADPVAGATRAVDTAEEGLRRALDGGDQAEIRQAKQALRQARSSLYRVVRGPHWSSPAPDEILDVDALVRSLRTKTDPVRQALLKATMTPALKAAGLTFDLSNPLAAKVLAQSGSQIKSIADTTQLNVMRIIGAAHSQGLSIPDTAKAIRAGMKEAAPARATLIARTELAGAVNGGSLAAMRIVSDETGDKYEKRWLTAPGATFPRHELYEGLDGQTVGLEEPFDVGGDSLMFPGDPDGSPEEVCNCRCTVVYDTPTGEQEGDADSGIGNAGGTAPTPSPTATPATVDTISVGPGPALPLAMRQKINQLGLDTWPPRKTEAATRIFGSASDTTGLYKTGGDWTADRQALHDKIVAAHFDGKKAAAEGERRTTYFTAGGGASGKSAALFDVGGKDVGLDELGTHQDVVWIDPDRIKEMLPEYKTLRDENDFYAAAGVHEESSEIAKRITAEAQRRGLSMIVDTTGSSDGFLAKLKAAQAAGHDVKVTMFSIPTNEAIARAMARGDKRGRYVAIEALKKAHAGASKQLGVWRDSPTVKEWRVYDNSGTSPALVAKGIDGVGEVIDRAKFDAILAKAGE